MRTLNCCKGSCGMGGTADRCIGKPQRAEPLDQSLHAVSTMEEIDRRAVMQLIRSIRVISKDELHIEFNYQDEYKKRLPWQSRS